MRCRIDSSSRPRIDRVSCTAWSDSPWSTSPTSTTGMPSTDTFPTELSTRPLLSTAVMDPSEARSMAAGRCARTVTRRRLGNCLLTLASVTPGMSSSWSMTSSLETKSSDLPVCLPAICMICSSLTHSLPPDTWMPPVSSRNTGEKNSSQTKAATAASAAVMATARRRITRAVALRRSFRRARKSTTFGRVTTPSCPRVWFSVLATRSSPCRRLTSTNSPGSDCPLRFGDDSVERTERAERAGAAAGLRSTAPETTRRPAIRIPSRRRAPTARAAARRPSG